MISAMIKKEFLLVFRDKHALAALFIMPSIFILIMSMALKDEFGEDRALLLYSVENYDTKEYSQKLLSSLATNPLLEKVDINSSKAQFVLSIPKRFSSSYKRSSAKEIPLHVEVSSDVKADILSLYKAQLMQSLMRIKLESIKAELAKKSPSSANKLDTLTMDIDSLITTQYNNFDKGVLPTSTQQSVPMWIVFGLFFVVIPMSTIFINERRENTLIRLTSMNVTIFSFFIGKITPYLLINQIQIWLMIGVGLFIVPLLGADALTLGDSFTALVILSLALSFSAISLALLIATLASTVEQATTVGGIINILFGAIGGLMVPKHIMPPEMQSFADISPMSWGFEGYLDIFLRNEGIVAILPETVALLLFATVMMGLSAYILKTKLSKGI